MNIQFSVFWAITAALLLGQAGCTSLLGHRYHDGAEVACAECEQSPHPAGEAAMTPPHSRFHPVPTRPVFSPQPQAATITVAAHSAPAPQEKIARRAEVEKPAPQIVGAPITAPTTSNLKAAQAIQHWANDTQPEAAARPAASGASSRRIAAEEPELAPAPLPAQMQNILEPAPVPSPAPSSTRTAWTDRFDAGDGWRPRVAR